MPPPTHLGPEWLAKNYTKADLTDFGSVLSVLMGIDDRYKFDPSELAIVHLAAIPAPGHAVDQKTFENNVMSTYNIFEAARKLGIKNIVSASSETLLGIPLVRMVIALFALTAEAEYCSFYITGSYSTCFSANYGRLPTRSTGSEA